MQFAIKPLGSLKSALDCAITNAPYLARLHAKYPQIMDELEKQSPEDLIANIIKEAKSAQNLELSEAIKVLRYAKAKMHLLLALSDLAGKLPLFEITKALSDLADAALSSALTLAIKEAPERDKEAFIEDENGALMVPGLFIIAMGKHGARELNYSSDVDLAAFYEREIFAEEQQGRASAICVRIIGTISRILEEVTPDNYVFRVDWRLRPDPSSTPIAVSTRFAESYYESVGQNWERAAFIKARFIAGSQTHAESFLEYLTPFIWRKYLDFAAINDVGSILRQIHAVRRSTDLDNPAFDVKLGRGGIREIEFFVQTQQLILGGRDKAIRPRETKNSLRALADAGRISKEIHNDLLSAYIYLRNVEHRIQMLHDEQTHALSEDQEIRSRVAVLCGFSSLDDFDKEVRKVRETVRTHIKGLFPDSAPLSSDAGSLVFTGVDHDKETIDTIKGLGFKDPEYISSAIRGWHHGRIRATRTARARELLTSLTPNLLAAIAATGDADIVFRRFEDFFAGLSAGVQTLSLFSAEPQILKQTCMTFALSEKLAGSLARKPAILDAMLSPRFLSRLSDDAPDERINSLKELLSATNDFEMALDIVRRFHREEAFRIGFHTLHLYAIEEDIGKAYSDLAIACIKGLLPFALAEVQKSHGNFAGQFAVCAWGKLGGRELSADSDLDLMLVYEPNEGAEVSDGARPLSSESYYAKLTQKLVLALSAPTGEGELYETDMQLRPSGKKGPVAVRFSSFVSYYETEAWVWEFQALTRLSPLAGDAELIEKIEKARIDAICRKRETKRTLHDIIEMRGKISDAMKPRGDWDLKRLKGGLIELEFFAQAMQLIHADAEPQIISQNTLVALGNLAKADLVGNEEIGRLLAAGAALNKVRQILALVAGPEFDPKSATDATMAAIAQTLNAPDFNSAKAILDDARQTISKKWEGLKEIVQ